MDRQAEWRQQNLEAMRDPQTGIDGGPWPIYPLLPLKNYAMVTPGEHPKTGVMCAWDKSPKVYLDYQPQDLGVVQSLTERKPASQWVELDLASEFPFERMPELRKRLERLPSIVYDSFEAMYDAGWLVD